MRRITPLLSAQCSSLLSFYPPRDFFLLLSHSGEGFFFQVEGTTVSARERHRLRRDSCEVERGDRGRKSGGEAGSGVGGWGSLCACVFVFRHLFLSSIFFQGRCFPAYRFREGEKNILDPRRGKAGNVSRNFLFSLFFFQFFRSFFPSSSGVDGRLSSSSSSFFPAR